MKSRFYAEEELIFRAQAYAEELLNSDRSGHGADHTMRVYRLACRIAENESVDRIKVKVAALLHDVDDVKLFPETAKTKANAARFLKEAGCEDADIAAILTIIEQVSFIGTDSVKPDTPEGCCVQDADRLDAIGAIGIARAFTYGGSHGRALYDPNEPPRLNMTEAEYRSHISTTLNHFYEKLLLLKDRMTTETGRALAKERHRYLEGFLEEFLAEWEGTR